MGERSGRARESPTRSTTEWLNTIKEAFPAAKNISQEAENAFVFELANKRKLYVNIVDEILLTPTEYAKAKKDYGENLSNNITVDGKVQTVGADAIITLARDADKSVIEHEGLHFAEQTVLNSAEKLALNKKYPSQEQRAEAYREWRQARKNGKGTLFGKLWKKIYDFAKQVQALFSFENEHNVFRKVESGEVWGREVGDKAKSEAQASISRGDMVAEKLASDVKAWGKTIDELSAARDLAGNKLATTPVKVMETPLSLQLLGHKNLPIYIMGSKFYKIQRDLPAMTAQIFKQIPNALADPMIIFESASKDGRIVVCLDLEDAKGVKVVVPFALNVKEHEIDMNLIVSSYGKNGGTKFTDISWFAKNIESDKTLYANIKKTTDLFTTARVQFPIAMNKISGSINSSIPTEKDLVKLKKRFPENYSIKSPVEKKMYNPWITESTREKLIQAGKDLVDTLKNTAKDRTTLSSLEQLTEAPDILRELKVLNSPIKISRGLGLAVMKPENTGQHAHGLSYEMLSQIPLALNEPVFVIKSATRADSVVVFTDIKDNKERSVIVPVMISKDNKLSINLSWITSVYGRNAEDIFFVKQYLNGNVLYANTEKSPAWASSHRLQLSRATLKQSSLLEQSIAKKNQNVNNENFSN